MGGGTFAGVWQTIPETSTMRTIPIRHLTLHSDLTPSEAQSRLAMIVLEGSRPGPGSRMPAGKTYYGTLSTQSFHLNRFRLYGTKNVWIPTFHGTIRPTPIGTDIDVTVSLEGIHTTSVLVYHLVILVFLILGLIVSLALCLVVFLLFAIADGWGYYESFVRGVRSFESEIRSALSKA